MDPVLDPVALFRRLVLEARSAFEKPSRTLIDRDHVARETIRTLFIREISLRRLSGTLLRGTRLAEAKVKNQLCVANHRCFVNVLEFYDERKQSLFRNSREYVRT